MPSEGGDAAKFVPEVVGNPIPEVTGESQEYLKLVTATLSEALTITLGQAALQLGPSFPEEHVGGVVSAAPQA